MIIADRHGGDHLKAVRQLQHFGVHAVGQEAEQPLPAPDPLQQGGAGDGAVLCPVGDGAALLQLEEGFATAVVSSS
jgi:hypothetical protein